MDKDLNININNDNETEVINSMLKAYVARAFSNVVAMYDINSDPSFDNGEYYGKALGKISKWANNSNLVIHKIIRAYFQLAKHGDVTYSALLAVCSDSENHPDIYTGAFATTFSQLKTDSERSAGKIFEVNDGIVELWHHIEPRLLKYKDDFLNK